MADGKIQIQSTDSRIYTVTPEVGAVGNVAITLPKEGGMLTVDSEVVHKTGNETKTGTMTFMDNVGIGVTPSAWAIGVKALFLGSKTSFYEYAGYTAINNNGILSDSGWSRKFDGYCSMYEQFNGTHYWSKAPSGTAGNPITWNTAMTLDASGNLLLTGGGGLGYGAGSGGTVTQLTSKSTAVTINKPCGSITMNNASLAANTTVSFAVSNSLYTLDDNVIVTLRGGYGGFGSYQVWAVGNTGGQFYVNVRNITAGALAEGIIICFEILKGAIS